MNPTLTASFENDQDPEVDFRVLNSTELMETFPVVAHGGKDMVGCVDNQAGVLCADKCTDAIRVSFDLRLILFQ